VYVQIFILNAFAGTIQEIAEMEPISSPNEDYASEILGVLVEPRLKEILPTDSDSEILLAQFTSGELFGYS